MAEGISKIRKRDGSIADFDKARIAKALDKAFEATDEGSEQQAWAVTDAVTERINKKFHKNSIPAVEEIQDTVEEALMEKGFPKTAKAYILYRQKHAELRKGLKEDDAPFDNDGLRIAREKYLLKDEEGNTIETPVEMFRRVAKAMAIVERRYGNDAKPIEEKFFSVLNSLEFIPGGRILAEAGTESSQLFSCFVLPLEDSMKNIFKTLYEKALIQRVGGGIGFSFSKIRPRGILSTMKGYAHGPLDFLELFDHATELTKLPGNRKSANMGSLSVHHPDIIHFITAKEGENKLTNFNLSVEITDAFMKALEKDEQYDLMSPATGKVVGRNSARQTFNLLATMAWKNGEPGILFIDTINKDNPLKKIGRIETTDPCGDQPLFPYEGVPLGALNLSKFVKDKEVDYDRLEEAVPIAVRFLDNAVDACKLPLNAVTTRTKELRRIGFGILGFADMLYQMRIPYNSQLGLETGKKVMQTIRKGARTASEELAEEKGPFPLWETSSYRSKKIRNATITTISPTGSRSLLAGTSFGIEPVYALAYKRKLMGSQETVIVNNFFLQALREKDLYSEELISQIAQTGNINDAKSPTIEMKKVFVTAMEIPAEWHIRMQAAFQEYVDNSISKTINIPNGASIEDIENAFLLAYKSGCKGITVYRDGSRSDQVYTSGAP